MASSASRLTPAEARRYLLAQLLLRRVLPDAGKRGVRALLEKLRCIQLDPLDPMGTNADFVALARVDGIARGDVYAHLLPGFAFEHFAKERCLLPASAFPFYRGHVKETSWWGHEERIRRVPPLVLTRVLRHIRKHGPVTTADLGDHGTVERMDWGGWRGTASAAAMALEVLWARCDIVVCGRAGRGKRYDIPARALATAAGTAKHARAFDQWALIERIEAAGLLSRHAGAHWSMLRDVRCSALPDRLVKAGVIEEVEIDGSSIRYLAPRGFRDRPQPEWDGRTRLLGPLDPLLWNRKLIHHVFGFEYVWEVYKPAALRRWGWYVCPILQDEKFVGRLEGRVQDDVLRIDRLWGEPRSKLDRPALDAALLRHAKACGATRAMMPR